jgi:hypothetical protein
MKDNRPRSTDVSPELGEGMERWRKEFLLDVTDANIDDQLLILDVTGTHDLTLRAAPFPDCRLQLDNASSRFNLRLASDPPKEVLVHAAEGLEIFAIHPNAPHSTTPARFTFDVTQVRRTVTLGGVSPAEALQLSNGKYDLGLEGEPHTFRVLNADVSRHRPNIPPHP